MKQLVSISFVMLVACGSKEGSSSGSSSAPAADGKIQIAVTDKGFEPDTVTVPAAKPVTLVFTRKTDQTCAKEVVLTMDDGTKVERALPLDKPIELAATFPKAGKLTYACGMDMIKGTLVVQ